MITYFNGRFLPLEEVYISPFDRGFQFADGVYEALITYNGRLFLYNEHLARLKRSLHEIKLNYPGIEKLEEVIYELMQRNNLTDASVYVQVTRGSSYPRRHVFPPSDVQPTLFVTVTESITAPDEKKTGVKVILEKDIRWDRCDIKTLMLLPACCVKQKASENNAYEAVWVRDGMIKEGAHTNIFVVDDTTVITPPLSSSILPGVTRQFVIRLCKKHNIKIHEEEIEAGTLKTIDEVFITGTTTEIRPVTQVNDRIVKDGKPGSITRTLQDLFYKTVLAR